MSYKFRVKLRHPDDQATYEYYDDAHEAVASMAEAQREGLTVEECCLVERDAFDEWADKYMPSVLIGLLLAVMIALALWPWQ